MDIPRKKVAGCARRRPPAPEDPPTAGGPCGACKFLRRKCVGGCVFAPYFATDQGAARFAAVHKVFGASNVSKLLAHVPAARRHDAVATVSYEAQARLADPVYGCVSTVLALQQQVASLQAELSMVQTQLINSRLAAAAAAATTLQCHHATALLIQPEYSNTSSASNNLTSLGEFPLSFDLVDVGPPTTLVFEPLQLSQPSQDNEEDEENEDECQDPISFSDGICHRTKEH
ncbi:LOB domain-containing protein 20 [Acorus calamus]|uniref:LOB domain-containing protein 20 n=1 Tax=Acorus calamus TaxID=4465 RepID=A0AAV9D5M3_ACOCL|nr:LOB domain-containing protein 20 [Acorus calamus]